MNQSSEPIRTNRGCSDIFQFHSSDSRSMRTFQAFLRMLPVLITSRIDCASKHLVAHDAFDKRHRLALCIEHNLEKFPIFRAEFFAFHRAERSVVHESLAFLRSYCADVFRLSDSRIIRRGSLRGRELPGVQKLGKNCFMMSCVAVPQQLKNSITASHFLAARKDDLTISEIRPIDFFTRSASCRRRFVDFYLPGLEFHFQEKTENPNRYSQKEAKDTKREKQC